MASTATPAPSGSKPRETSKPREWRPVDLVVLACAVIVMFAVIFWAALGKPPLAGTAVVATVGYIFAVFANVSLGALVSGAIVEYRHPGWTRLRGFDHVFLAVALTMLVAADGAVAWWLFTSDPGGSGPWLFLLTAAVAAAGGAWWAWPVLRLPGRRLPAGSQPRWALWPHHRPDAPRDEMWRCFTPLSGLLGGALGVAVAVGYLGISAAAENSAAPAGHALPAAPAGIHGSYVALGDSYSAGEGLPPFADGTALTACDRSVSGAYPTLLYSLLRRQDAQASLRFTACSGAVISDILRPAHRATLVPPQISGTVQPSVGLVTLTIGGNNAIFSKVVATCVTAGNCLEARFPPPGVREATARPVPPGPMIQWGPRTIEQIGLQDAALFHTLRRDFPNARIVAVGYPYLFPLRSAPGFPFFPPGCASILNRLSVHERVGIRALQDEFNDRTYEEAVAAGIEFVSPVAIWDGHEPCGASGQYTNSIKPYLNFPNPVNGGSFHPNSGGQRTIAALLACYLDRYPKPPDPYAAGAAHAVTIPAARLVAPAQLHLQPAPGRTAVPGAGVVPGC